jgi:hypothetical protein
MAPVHGPGMGLRRAIGADVDSRVRPASHVRVVHSTAGLGVCADGLDPPESRSGLILGPVQIIPVVRRKPRLALPVMDRDRHRGIARAEDQLVKSLLALFAFRPASICLTAPMTYL